MRKFKEGQIVKHKISGEEFVIIKYRNIFYRILCFTLKEYLYVSKGKYSSDYFHFYESELRTLTDSEIKQKEDKK